MFLCSSHGHFGSRPLWFGHDCVARSSTGCGAVENDENDKTMLSEESLSKRCKKDAGGGEVAGGDETSKGDLEPRIGKTEGQIEELMRLQG